MCSGILTPGACKFIEEHFGKIPQYVFCEPSDCVGLRISPSVDIPLQDVPLEAFGADPILPPTGKNAKRAELDYWLCRCSDAEIIDGCRFVGYQERGGDLILKLDIGGQEREVITRYLVGADGPLSRVRRSVAPGFDEKLRMIPNYEEWYTGNIDLEPGWLYMFFDKKITGYFATVFHKDGNIVVVTGCEQKESVKDYFQAFVSHLKKKHGLVIKEKVASDACVLHDMSATDNFFLGRGKVLLAGEAGGFNHCAEGISSALITGKAAGDAILQSQKTGKAALDFYAEAAAPEEEACRLASRNIEQAVGLNPFTRT
jgi:flavin-dependent dehydrogenase